MERPRNVLRLRGPRVCFVSLGLLLYKGSNSRLSTHVYFAFVMDTCGIRQLPLNNYHTPSQPAASWNGRLFQP
jgi:hypothetical protein